MVAAVDRLPTQSFSGDLTVRGPPRAVGTQYAVGPVASGPFQPIPETTQVHADRLVGAKLGDLEVGARVCEGRFGTIYRARLCAPGKDVTLEVLRTELLGDDHEVRASNAVKCAGIADVFEFGQVPDGRRYRVMEFLDGESLDQVLQRRGRLSAREVAVLLGQVAEVLKVAHAWALPHGSLGPSSVFLVRDAVKLIDFGLAKRRASFEADLQQLGALGFTLLTGEDLEDRAPPPPGSGIPEPIDLLLRDLIDTRVKDATEARQEFARVETLLGATPPPAARPTSAPRRAGGLPWVALATVLAAGGAAAVSFWSRAPQPPTAGQAGPGEGRGPDDAVIEPGRARRRSNRFPSKLRAGRNGQAPSDRDGQHRCRARRR
ncbi:MAG: hypothetical protein H6Q89_5636 [Myxococcaceae bacterium]|nr:hypothetical protein [Myxococcaceae bacterium]